MFGATLYLLKDITQVLNGASGIQFGIYASVFLLSTYLIYRQKISTQWVVLGTITLGLIATFIS